MSTAEPNQGQRFPVGLLWLLVPIVILCLVIPSENKQNQLLPQPPGGAQPPVVPQLANLAADLAGARSYCEDKARELKVARKQRKLTEKDIQEDRELYARVKSSQEALISFLCIALDRRFRDDDTEEVRQLRENLRSDCLAFLTTADGQLQPGQFGSADPVSASLEQILRYLDRTRQANQQAIDGVKQSLRESRMKSWDELAVDE